MDAGRIVAPALTEPSQFDSELPHHFFKRGSFMKLYVATHIKNSTLSTGAIMNWNEHYMFAAEDDKSADEQAMRFFGERVVFSPIDEIDGYKIVLEKV